MPHCVLSLCDGVNILGYSGNIALPHEEQICSGPPGSRFSDQVALHDELPLFQPEPCYHGPSGYRRFFPGRQTGYTVFSSPAIRSRPWYLVAGLTTNITTNTTNDIHYSFLRNWWSWGASKETPISCRDLAARWKLMSRQSRSSQDLGPYNVNTQQTRTRFWDGHDQMIRDDVSMLKGNHLFQFGRHVPAQL